MSPEFRAIGKIRQIVVRLDPPQGHPFDGPNGPWYPELIHPSYDLTIDVDAVKISGDMDWLTDKAELEIELILRPY